MRLLLTILVLVGLTACEGLVSDQGGGWCPSDAMAQPGPALNLSSGTELSLGFYNLENLFDTLNDPFNTGDDWVLVEEKIGWEEGNYKIKIDNLARAISSMDESGLDILGIAEVENACVIADLIDEPGLSQRPYRIVHEESSDHRGIDVALIYDPGSFQYQAHQTFEVDYGDGYRGRSILLVEGKVNQQKLFILVNHWPSRGGGQEKTEPRRLKAAQAARDIVEDLQSRDPSAAICLMGDFNDDPLDPSIRKVLGAISYNGQYAQQPGLYNPMAPLHDPEREGSLTYRGKYNLFDQIILNGELLTQEAALAYQPGSATIHHPNFMRFKGRGPSRAIHRGEFKPYGFSDHFPVYLKLRVKK